jgi:putative membrane protein
MVPFGWRIVINAVALWLVDGLWNSVEVTPRDEGVVARIAVYLVVGLIIALVNSIVKPLAKTLTIFLYILTLGLFGLILNALMLELTSWLTGLIGFGLHIENFTTAIGAGLVLAILTALISIPFRKAPRAGRPQVGR